MKKKSEFLRALGIAWQIWQALINAVLDMGGDDDCVRLIETNANLRQSLARLIVEAGQQARSISRLVIDCDADPMLPNGWQVVEHQKGGQLEWDPAKIALYLSKQQKDGHWLKGDQLREELKGKPVLNANVLDYLLAHPQLIPEEWKGKAVFFWGTIYRGSDGYLFVRYLYWYGCGWGWRYSCWLDFGWCAGYPAAVLAK